MSGEIDIAAVDAKLAELNAAYSSARWTVSTSPILSAQDALYGESIRSAIFQTQASLAMLGGDLYQAVLGNHVFPLDAGTDADPEAALVIWNKIAGDVQDTLTGIGGYIEKWGPMPSAGFLSALKNPLDWPWYIQAAAGGAILVYGLQFLGLVGNTRRALGRRRR